jgi:excisionase family DNA binding protein
MNKRKPQNPLPDQLLYSRSQAARLLGCSTMTIKRLEQAGRLSAIRLIRKPTASVYFRAEEVHALAR